MSLVSPAAAQTKWFDLNSSNKAVSWRLQSAEKAGDTPQSSIFPQNWVTAVVPGTVFTSYVSAGLEKDPNFGDNIYQVDSNKYLRDYWFCAEFAVPKTSRQRIWLNFEGINRKGEVYFNGQEVGRLNGFMERGKFDITAVIRRDRPNILAVLVHPPVKPIPNLASPTYISSDGWDWMPKVPDLLTGITDDVYLSTSGDVTLEDPWIRTMVPSPNSGEVSLDIPVVNHSNAAKTVTVSGIIQPGNIRFSQPVTVESGHTQTVKFDKAKLAALAIRNPKLWWPVGYGDPNLYKCQLSLSIDGKTSDSRTIPFGIKQYSYDSDGDVFHLHINGKRIFMKGGNWGMSEYLLRCRGNEYDLKVRLHRDMHFNMIRNWIGSTTDEEFYEACDKYGILVWDDFWLNSHPNLPTDLSSFRKNAIEKIKRLRNHPSIAVWCGDNEGTPVEPLNEWLREDVGLYDGNDRWYQPCSNTGALSGSGFWVNFNPAWYFTKYPANWSKRQSFGMRTEIGTAVFTNFESFKKFMPQDKWWPRNDMWDKHFFGPSALNAGPDIYMNTVNKSYGESKGIEEFCRKAQLVNIEVNKAMFEGWQHNMWDDASGILTWMSQSAYPSFVWQTYDYYYDLNGAYWGSKKACEPVHIQWSGADNSVKVVNTTSTDLNNVRARATVYNADGKAVPGMSLVKTIAKVPTNSATNALELNFNPENLALKADVKASSNEGEGKRPADAVDGGNGSRWSSLYTDEQWLQLDLKARKTFTQVQLLWEAAYGKAYKIQVSDDGQKWRDVYSTESGDGGSDFIEFPAETARYIRMLGIKRGSMYGYSLYEFEVYNQRSDRLSKLHFVKLNLEDANGKPLSDNFYWRSTQGDDFTDLNTMPKATLNVTQKMRAKGGKLFISVKLDNPKNAPPAIATRVTPVFVKSGEQVLPVMMNDNYVSLMPGESKQIEIEVAESVTHGEALKLKVEPFNN